MRIGKGQILMMILMAVLAVGGWVLTAQKNAEIRQTRIAEERAAAKAAYQEQMEAGVEQILQGDPVSGVRQIEQVPNQYWTDEVKLYLYYGRICRARQEGSRDIRYQYVQIHRLELTEDFPLYEEYTALMETIDREYGEWQTQQAAEKEAHKAEKAAKEKAAKEAREKAAKESEAAAQSAEREAPRVSYNPNAGKKNSSSGTSVSQERWERHERLRDKDVDRFGTAEDYAEFYQEDFLEDYWDEYYEDAGGDEDEMYEMAYEDAMEYWEENRAWEKP